jgi:hypothetical protein
MFSGDFGIQGTFREHSGNIQKTFREHSGNVQGTFRERSGNIEAHSNRRRSLSSWGGDWSP